MKSSHEAGKTIAISVNGKYQFHTRYADGVERIEEWIPSDDKDNDDTMNISTVCKGFIPFICTSCSVFVVPAAFVLTRTLHNNNTGSQPRILQESLSQQGYVSRRWTETLKKKKTSTYLHSNIQSKGTGIEKLSN